MRISEPVFDAYHATVFTVADLLTDGIADALGVTRVERIKPRNGYTDSVRLHRLDDPICDVMHGGYNPLPFLFAQGQYTPELVAALRERFPDHSVARADVKRDLDDGPGTYDRVRAQLLALSSDRGLKWREIISSGTPGEGFTPATFYTGAESARVAHRGYCKGLQLMADGVDLAGTGFTQHTVRSEFQVRPASSKKAALAVATPDQLCGASPWARELSTRLCGAATGKLSVGTVKHVSDEQQRLLWLHRQQGRFLEQLVEKYGWHEAATMVLGSHR